MLTDPEKRPPRLAVLRAGASFLGWWLPFFSGQTLVFYGLNTIFLYYILQRLVESLGFGGLQSGLIKVLGGARVHDRHGAGDPKTKSPKELNPMSSSIEPLLLFSKTSAHA